ncbi:MAG: sulfite exporter TauE/SafE family protein [Solirubrobacteraceae bacterium]
MISAGDCAVLVAAGVLAGIVGTAGGITSLISYPALLAIGIPALHANIANKIALVATGPGSALASQPELEGRLKWLLHWVPVTAAGSIAGTALLLLTPAGMFARVVPALVAVGSLALLFEPRLSALRDRQGPGASPLVLAGGLFILTLYNGYFGAGSGVMTLALLLMEAEREITVANALKNMLLGVATVVSAVVLVMVSSAIDWPAVGALAAGAFVGGTVGPRVARWLPRELLRVLVAAMGIGLAIQLLVSNGR